MARHPQGVELPRHFLVSALGLLQDMDLMSGALELMLWVPQTMALVLLGLPFGWSWMKLLVPWALALVVLVSTLMLWALLLPAKMLWTLQTRALQQVFLVAVHQQGFGFP